MAGDPIIKPFKRTVSDGSKITRYADGWILHLLDFPTHEAATRCLEEVGGEIVVRKELN
jgi:hypothetical protein